MKKITVKPPAETFTDEDLKAWRAERGISQADLATILGINLRTVQRWEAGDNTPPPFLRDALASPRIRYATLGR